MTLKPETNSDSPSVKSKGAQSVSARVEMTHIMANGHDEKIDHKHSWVIIRVDDITDSFPSSTDNRIIASVTPYEIVLLLGVYQLRYILSLKLILIRD